MATDEGEEKRSRWPLIAVGVAVVVLVVTFFVGIEFSSTGGNASSTECASVTTDSMAVTVQIRDYKYCPQSLSINRGAVVTFFNDDKVQHTATEKDKASWDTQVIHEGGSTPIEFDIPGTYEYFCTIHPYMTGTVNVR